jgi:hypothetical protein
MFGLEKGLFVLFAGHGERADDREGIFVQSSRMYECIQQTYGALWTVGMVREEWMIGFNALLLSASLLTTLMLLTLS